MDGNSLHRLPLGRIENVSTFPVCSGARNAYNGVNFAHTALVPFVAGTALVVEIKAAAIIRLCSLSIKG